MKTVKTVIVGLAAAVVALTAGPPATAQETPLDRLPRTVFDVVPPSDHVQGLPGQMRVNRNGCRVLPTAESRRRIVDVAVQEWGFFGFSIVDETVPRERFQPDEDRGPDRRRFRRRRVDPEQAARVASSIGGYWAATSDGSWIIERQNQAWNGSRGIGSRWRDPWSAAFISWIMCESGLGSTAQFERAIAHHVYIDQAIRARDGNAPGAAFTAYDPGETAIEPGDLLCSARRPGYRTIAERRRQMGVGARTHCDVVVKTDPEGERILAIGGNVRGTVSLKLLPAVAPDAGVLRPEREIFAHLKLNAGPIGADALDSSPTIEALACTPDFTPSAQLVSAGVSRTTTSVNHC